MPETGIEPPFLIGILPSHLAGITWKLTGRSHIVGRLGDIQLTSPDVSKRHAELRQGSDGVWLNDLNSSNGVLRNGKRVEPGRPAKLVPGDRLQFGSVQLIFRVGAEHADTRLLHQVDGHDRATAGPTDDWSGEWSASGIRSGWSDAPSEVTDLGDFRSRSKGGRRYGRQQSADRRDDDLPPPPPRHAAPPPVENDARTMATRHLAAATQLDPWFAGLVVDQVVDEPYRALAPVFGADLGIVTRWALAARRRRLVRDLALLALLLGLAGLVGLGVHTHLKDLKTGSLGAWWRVYAVGAGFVLVLAWLVTALDAWVTQYLVLRRKLAQGRFEPADAPGSMSGRVRERLAAVAERPAGNVVVCSGYWPFAGSGDQVDEWDMPVDIRKGAPYPDAGGRRSPQPFATGELYDVLIASARNLGLANLRVEERLFADGHDVQRDRRLLPDPLRPPVTRIPSAVIRGMSDGLGTTSRTYVSIEVPAWSGQLVLTMFLRAVQVHGTLYLEWSAYALLPMLPEYYAVDFLPYRTGAGAAIRALGSALPIAPRALLVSPVALARRAAANRAAAARRRGQRRTIRGGYRFDYGAHLSVREFARGVEEGRYFLDRDLSRVLRTTQQHLMNTIGDFLASKGIDSDDFDRVQQGVIQNFTTNNDYSQHIVRARDVHGPIAQGRGARASSAPRRSGGGPAATPSANGG